MAEYRVEMLWKALFGENKKDKKESDSDG